MMLIPTTVHRQYPSNIHFSLHILISTFSRRPRIALQQAKSSSTGPKSDTWPHQFASTTVGDPWAPHPLSHLLPSSVSPSTFLLLSSMFTLSDYGESLNLSASKTTEVRSFRKACHSSRLGAPVLSSASCVALSSPSTGEFSTYYLCILLLPSCWCAVSLEAISGCG